MNATDEKVTRRLEKLCDDLDKETLQLMRLRKEIKESIKSSRRKRKLLGNAEASFREVDLHVLRRFLEISRDNCRRVASMFDERMTELDEESGGGLKE